MMRTLTPLVCAGAIAMTVIGLPGIPALAQERAVPPGAAGPADLERGVATAPVSIDGTVVLRVRGVASFPAEERARRVADRIRDLAANAAVRPDALRIEHDDAFDQITADGKLVIAVTDADAAVDGVSREALARVYVNQIRNAIVSYRADRSAPALRRAGLEAAGLTLAFAGLALAIIWLRRRIDARLDRQYRERVESLDAKSKAVVSVTRLWDTLRAAIRLLRTALVVVLAFLYLRNLFWLFPQTRPAANLVTASVVVPLQSMWRSFVTEIPNLLFLAILVVLVRIVLRIVRRFFDAVEQGRIHLANFDREWAAPTYKLLRPGIVAFAVVVGYPYIPGSGSEAFKGVSLFLGVIFSLGSSSFIANMIAGYSMTYRRAFRLGDFVKIGDAVGVVSAVRLQVTHVRTVKNEEVVVPNSQILNSLVVNYSALAQSDGLILHTTVGIGYETPWRQVEAMLIEAARRTPGLAADPPPFVHQLQLGDFCVTYELNVHCRQATNMRTIYTDLHRNILDVFNEYSVQIMTPAYEGDPAVPKVVPRDQWHIAPAKREGEHS